MVTNQPEGILPLPTTSRPNLAWSSKIPGKMKKGQKVKHKHKSEVNSIELSLIEKIKPSFRAEPLNEPNRPSPPLTERNIKIRQDAIPFAELRQTPEIKNLLNSIKNDPNKFNSADESLKRDRDFVIAALKKNFQVIELLGDEYWQDKEILLAILKKHENLAGNFDFMLKAVKFHGSSLEYASPELKQDEDIVLAAVTQDGTALQFAGDLLNICPNP